MADGKIKISELGSALQLSDNAKFPFSQDNGGTETTYGAEITQMARKIAEGVSLTNLETTAKTLVGAINELSHLGNPIIIGTTAPTSSQGADGNIYVQYTEGTGGASDTVDSIYAKIDGAWCEIETGGGGGSGGHTIVDDSGTALTQRTNLQFKGAYSEDNSTDDITEIDVVREMTKAEFDELTEAEKTGLINITDITGGNDDRFQPVIYSEDEREIGVWTDGKPLYEKTIYVDSFPNNTSKNLSTPTNLELLVDSFGFMKSTTLTGYFRTLPFAAGGTNDVRVDLNGGTLRVVTFSDWSAYDGYITIRYTKSTDQAGSGQWTPQGVPAHHYSEDEQVVGTWIDGSTVYEKTYTIADLDYSTSESFKELFTVPDADTIINISGRLTNSTNTSQYSIPYCSSNSKYAVVIFEDTANHGNAKSFFFRSNDTWADGSLLVVVRYTKSST